MEGKESTTTTTVQTFSCSLFHSLAFFHHAEKIGNLWWVRRREKTKKSAQKSSHVRNEEEEKTILSFFPPVIPKMTVSHTDETEKENKNQTRLHHGESSLALSFFTM